MERLSDNAIDIINQLHTERLNYISEYIPLIDALERLAAYEDTGLEPEEMEELAQAKKDGRLVVPPCKVGDVVYWLDRKRYQIKELKILHFSVGLKGIDEIGCLGGDYTPIRFYTNDIGKTVFRTLMEAKAVKGGEENC